MKPFPDLLGQHQGRLILDCDEVLLQWWPHFIRHYTATTGRAVVGKPDNFDMSKWLELPIAELLGHIRAFNDGADTGFHQLTPVDGAVDALTKLRAAGCTFRVITSCSADPEAMRRREENLIGAYGDIFDEIVCIQLGSEKRKSLRRHKPSIFLDDHPANVVAGREEGHAALLMSADHNLSQHVELAETLEIVHGWPDFMLRSGFASEPAFARLGA